MTPESPQNLVSSAPCELLLKLFTGPRGEVHLARFMRGDDAGRFVMLREVAEGAIGRLAPSVDWARSIAHPKLLKLLGLVRTGGRTYLACEYVPGAALTELRQAARKLRSPIRAAVAARIVRDALAASETARTLLHAASGLDGFSAFHPDSIWIAEFGETMVVPIDAREALAAPRPSQPPAGSGSAIDLLLELATALPPAQVLADGIDTHLPAALADAVFAAWPQPDEPPSERGADAALLAALSPLQPPVVADEEQVRRELERFLGTTLEQRRRRQGVSDEEDETSANDATVMAHVSQLRRATSSSPDSEDGTRLLSVFSEANREREYDPDGVTQIAKSDTVPSTEPSVIVAPDDKLPSPAIISNPSWPQQFLEQTQMSKRKALSSMPPPQNQAARGVVVLLSLILLLLLALLGVYWKLKH
jgi:hypothetical protein